MDPDPPDRSRSRWKPLLDFGPLLVFFVVNWKWGLVAATGALVPAAIVALVASWRLEGRVSKVALYGTLAVIVFGGLTLALRDETFIKVKVTAINVLLGGILAVGLARKKPLLKELLGRDLRMTDAGWQQLTLRFTLFFFALAALNEVLRRQLSDDAWVSFKTFGVIGATLVFTLFQGPLVQRHALVEPERDRSG
jgi:intracellular septation protein